MKNFHEIHILFYNLQLVCDFVRFTLKNKVQATSLDTLTIDQRYLMILMIRLSLSISLSRPQFKHFLIVWRLHRDISKIKNILYIFYTCLKIQNCCRREKLQGCCRSNCALSHRQGTLQLNSGTPILLNSLIRFGITVEKLFFTTLGDRQPMFIVWQHSGLGGIVWSSLTGRSLHQHALRL